MATKKITDLTLLAASASSAADVLPIVDITEDVTKKITLTSLKSGSFSGSFQGDGSSLTGLGGSFTAAGISGSWQNQTSSMSVLSATTASYVLNAVSASYAASASYEITKEVSSSYADVAGGLTGQPSISVTSLTVSGSIDLTGSLNVSGSTINNTGPFNQTGVSTIIGDIIMPNAGTAYISSSGKTFYHFGPVDGIQPRIGQSGYFLNSADDSDPILTGQANSYVNLGSNGFNGAYKGIRLYPSGSSRNDFINIEADGNIQGRRGWYGENIGWSIDPSGSISGSSLEVTGNITASGDISASGDLTAANLNISNQIKISGSGDTGGITFIDNGYGLDITIMDDTSQIPETYLYTGLLYGIDRIEVEQSVTASNGFKGGDGHFDTFYSNNWRAPSLSTTKAFISTTSTIISIGGSGTQESIKFQPQGVGGTGKHIVMDSQRNLYYDHGGYGDFYNYMLSGSGDILARGSVSASMIKAIPLTPAASDTYSIRSSGSQEHYLRFNEGGSQIDQDFTIKTYIVDGEGINEPELNVFRVIGENSGATPTIHLGPNSSYSGSHTTYVYGKLNMQNASVGGDLVPSAAGRLGNANHNTLLGTNGPWNSLYCQEITASIISRSGSIGAITVQDDIVFQQHITSSGNISSSGIITADTGSFSYLKGNSPITVQDQITFQQPITASGAISSSEKVIAKSLELGPVDNGGILGITMAGSISASAIQIKPTGLEDARSYSISMPDMYELLFADNEGTRDTLLLNSSTRKITAYGDVSSSAASTASFGTYVGDGSYLTGVTGEWDGTHTGTATFIGNITASGDISSSGIITADTGSFSYLKGNSDINIAAGDSIIVQSGSVLISSSAAIWFDQGSELAKAGNDSFEINVGYLSEGTPYTNNIFKVRPSTETDGEGVVEVSNTLNVGDTIELSKNTWMHPNEGNISGSIVPFKNNKFDLGYNFSGASQTFAFRSGSINFITASYIESTTFGEINTTALDLAEGNITNVGQITCDQLFADSDVTNVFNLNSTNFQFSIGEIDKAIIDGNGLNVTGHITASGNISSSGIITADTGSFSYLKGNSPITIADELILQGGITLSPIQSAAATDTTFYSINGKRGEVRSKLQAGVAADTGWTLQLRNTSISASSLIVTNVVGGEGAIITGSIVTTNVISAQSASMNFWNTGVDIVDSAPFTASFAIL